HGLATLLKRSPFAELHDLELSTKFRWLLPIAAGMASKLVGQAMQHFDELILGEPIGQTAQRSLQFRITKFVGFNSVLKGR
ncbi:hypothetical protein AB9F41_34255, partial [Rhizobium leguminosarum]|uniref:hypothetical protein n=1 Tax=Rhizobium leguminosarum TaxID=384 RepID=UPI003F9707FF